MPSHLPAAITPCLDAYLNLMQTELPGLMQAFYLHGSIALDDYCPPFSDMDFVTVLSRQATASDIDALQSIHARLSTEYPDCKLSGSYLQPHDLGQPEEAIEHHPYYQDGRLHPAGHHDINYVTWWVLKHHGLTLFGPAPDFEISMTSARFLKVTLENLNSYWASFTYQPNRIVWLMSDYGIQWAVLGVLRQHYTFVTSGDITSKTGAGLHALETLPPRWHRIIEEALRIRSQQGDSTYKLRITRAVDAYRFMRFIIKYCNRMMV